MNFIDLKEGQKLKVLIPQFSSVANVKVEEFIVSGTENDKNPKFSYMLKGRLKGKGLSVQIPINSQDDLDKWKFC